MKMSEFWRSMEDEFGFGYARVVGDQTVLDAVGSRTANEALDDGVAPLRGGQAGGRQHELPEAQGVGPDPGGPR